MALAFPQLLPGWQRQRISGRALAFAIVVLVHLLLVLLLILIVPPAPKKRNDNTPSVFVLLPDSTPQRARKASARKRPAASKPLATTTVPPPENPVVPAKPVIFGELAYNAVDISKMPSAAPPGIADVGTGEDGDTAQGVGTGPGGVTLYKAEWQREPTQAELSFYLPKNQSNDSWGVIACRTAARNLVEDCVPMADYPGGSGIARGLVNAAWQFRVRPPRINGKPEIGSWVRIRIDFSSRTREE